MSQITLTRVTEELFVATQLFLLDILPEGTVVVQGQVNRVPEPVGENFVVMWQNARSRLATNESHYDYENSQHIQQSTQVSLQLDVHGPSSSDNAQIIMTLARDPFGVDFYKALGTGIAPLYTSEPKQIPFLNGEQQYEDRWTIDLELQVNPIVTIKQEYARSVDVTLIEVDAEYPPTAE